jgi:hypothetical protein
MIKNKEIRPCVLAITSAVRSLLVSQNKPDTGFLHSFSLPDFIEAIQSGEFHQMKLSSASAGSDLTVSPMRPDDFIGCGSGLKAGYVIGQKGSTSGECWGR